MNVMDGDMLVTHRLLAKLFAYNKLNAKYVCIDEVSQAVQLSGKKMPTPGCVLQDSCSPDRLGWNFSEVPSAVAVFSGSDLGRCEPIIGYGGLSADAEGWQQTPVAFTVAGPPLTTHRGLQRVCLCRADGGCGRECGDIVPVQMIAQKADI